MSTWPTEVRLTDLTGSGGCAAKYSAARLAELLAGFVPADEPRTCSSGSRLPTTRPSTGSTTSARSSSPSTSSRRSSTIPADFGAIAADERAQRRLRDGRHAAARALGRRVSRRSCRSRRSRRVFRARPTSRCARRAPCSPAGTRSATREPKYGLAVVGTVHPDGVWTKSGARPGDALFLTKPLGTGLVLHGRREGLASTTSARRGGRAGCGR